MSHARVLVCGVSTIVATSALAAPVIPGNPIVYRVGDGSEPFGSTAAAVFLDEFNPDGSLRQSIALPSTGPNALTAVGNGASEGTLSRSQDGSMLTFTGYRKSVGSGIPASAESPFVTNRLVGTLDQRGTVNPSAAVLNSIPGTTINGAATNDGSTYYVSTSTSVHYVSTPGGAATSTPIAFNPNPHQILLADNVLYGANGGTTVAAKVQSYGATPTGTTSPTAVVTLAIADRINGIFFADMNPLVAGVDVLYAASTVEDLLRK